MIVITTIGTSLIENLYKFLNDNNYQIGNKEKCKRENFNKIKQYLKNLRKNKQFKGKYNENFIKKEKGKSFYRSLIEFGKNCFPNSSAELTSLEKLRKKLDEKGKQNEKLDIYLIMSDTNEGRFIGEILEEVLKSENIKRKLNIKEVKVKYIKDLRIDSTETFEKGLDNLIEKIYEIIKKDNNNLYNKDEVIFNITGGYKGVIPYLSTIAQIFEYEIVYTFEDTEKENDLIKIKPLPLGFDEDFTDLYLPFLFEEGLEILNEIDKKETELKNIKKAKKPDIEKIRERENFLKNKEDLIKLIEELLKYNLIKKGNELELTPLGKLVRLKTKDKKGKLGYIFELLITQNFLKENPKLVIEPSKSYQINGKDGEIDIFIDKGKEIKAVEIKSLTKLYESKEQIQRHIRYLESLNKNFELKILIYVLDETILLKNKKFSTFIKELEKISSNIKVEYFEYKPKKLDALIKNFSKEIKLKEWKEDLTNV